MKKKIYFIQPTYRDHKGNLLKGNRLFIISIALPALSPVIPEDWEKEFCFEYFEDVNFETDATVIGISCMGYDIFRGIEIAQEFKSRGKLVIFGGCQSHLGESYIEQACDSIIHGYPGLEDMTEILKDAESNSLKKEYFCGININYRFDYSILDIDKIAFTSVILSVGCVNDCDYCSTAAIFKGKYRLRRLEYVIEELKYLGIRTKKIAFVDSNIYNNREYLIRLCNAMISNKFNFIWGTQCTINIGDDIETLRLLRRAGCRILFIGMETVEQMNLDGVHKRYSVNSYKRRIGNIHKAGIKIAGFFMYGFDCDTVDTSSKLSRFIIKSRIALPILNIIVPAPGTKIYDQLKEQGRLLLKDESEFLKNNTFYNTSCNLCLYIPKNMTPGQVEDGFYDLNRRLATFLQILWRSLGRDIPITLFLLYMNWTFRKEYLLLKRKRNDRAANTTD